MNESYESVISQRHGKKRRRERTTRRKLEKEVRKLLYSDHESRSYKRKRLSTISSSSSFCPSKIDEFSTRNGTEKKTKNNDNENLCRNNVSIKVEKRIVNNFVTETSVAVHDVLRNEWQKITKNGLSAEVRDELSAEYRLTENFEFLRAPKLNPELESCTPSKYVNLDQRKASVQNRLSYALIAIDKVLNFLLNPNDDEQNFGQSIEILVDAGRIIADNHYCASIQRRINFASAFQIDDIGDLSTVENHLFGEQFSNILRSAPLMPKIEKKMVTSSEGDEKNGKEEENVRNNKDVDNDGKKRNTDGSVQKENKNDAKQLEGKENEKKNTEETKEKRNTEETKEKKNTEETKEKVNMEETKEKKNMEETKETENTEETKEKENMEETKEKTNMEETKDKKNTKESKEKKNTEESKEKKNTEETKEKQNMEEPKEKQNTKETKEKKNMEETKEKKNTEEIKVKTSNSESEDEVQEVKIVPAPVLVKNVEKKKREEPQVILLDDVMTILEPKFQKLEEDMLSALREGITTEFRSQQKVEVPKGLDPNEDFPGIEEATRRAYKARGTCEGALANIINAHAVSTRKNYERPVRFWWEFCKKHNIDVYNGTARNVLHFFVENSMYISSVNVLQSWRSALGEFTVDDLSKDRAISNYIKGFENDKKIKMETRDNKKMIFK